MCRWLAYSDADRFSTDARAIVSDPLSDLALELLDAGTSAGVVLRTLLPQCPLLG